MEENEMNNNQKCKISKIKYDIPSEEKIMDQVELLKAMTDPTRLSILYLLDGHELCSCRIQAELDKSQPTISHHINILKKAKLIKGRRKGTWIYYSLRKPEIVDVIKKIE